jgi:hypothetical protein
MVFRCAIERLDQVLNEAVQLHYGVLNCCGFGRWPSVGATGFGGVGKGDAP